MAQGDEDDEDGTPLVKKDETEVGATEGIASKVQVEVLPATWTRLPVQTRKGSDQIPAEVAPGGYNTTGESESKT